MSATLLTVLLALPQAAPDTVVVCPATFREALGPWLEHRTHQGHTLSLLSNTDSPDEIRRRIRDAAKAGRLRFVLLVGDAEPGLDNDPALRARCVPVHRAKDEVNVLGKAQPHIATDNWYADLDGDRTPDVAVGRLTADTPEELRQIVAKILAYERSRDFGPWRRRLNFVAGISGLGPLTDMAIESSARYLLTRGIPADYRISMTYGSWRSPYCPDPRLFHATTLRRLNEGCWFWVYIGHGFHLTLDPVRVPGGRYHILGASDIPKLKSRYGPPIALFLACHSGAFDAKTDCLAERMLRCRDGPVAVVAGSRTTMPYGMAVLADGLMKQLFEHRPATLGEAVLHTKQRMMKEPGEGDHRRAMLDAVAALISPTANKLAAERAQHLLLFNLIGDPLLRLRYPKPIELEVPPTATAGQALKLAGTSPVDGRGTIELVVRHGRLTFQPPARRQYPQTPHALAEFQEIYRRANDDRLASVEVTVENGRFAARLEVPQESRGPCHVRVFVEGTGDFAMGGAEVTITGTHANR